MNLNLYYSTLKQKGKLSYEYLPFKNFLTDVDLYQIGNFLIPEDKAVNPKNGEILSAKDNKWVDKNGNIITDVLIPTGDPVIKAGSLIDLDTELFNFDIDHPVDITIQPSYDGSVNLILNDSKNPPRLINSRFSVREKNSYEIVDRLGENDTNIYNRKTFNRDTSLYFQHSYNPKISLNRLIDGNLSVGTYCFYFTYCDADDNESDIIAETGPIPVFIGTDENLFSIDGGIKNLNSCKGISLNLNNIDNSYNYLKIYYIRYFADYAQNKVVEGKKVYQKYPIKSNKIQISITGNELCEDIDPNILNIVLFNPKHILTLAQCKNMLFFGNIVLNVDNYKELKDCALRIIPRVITDFDIEFPDFKSTYSNSYNKSKNIYNKVGYFNNEYYRFGVVFIYDNGTLSNVYNTLGGIFNENITCEKSFYEIKDEIYLVRNYIESDEDGWIASGLYNGSSSYLNDKGVIYINESFIKKNAIYGIEFVVPQEVLSFLKELHIRGLFFVRQKCIPTLLAQCYLMPMDTNSHVPIIQYENSSGIQNISESFLVQGTKKDEVQKVTNVWSDRLYSYSKISETKAYAAICPDFLLNQPYYNQIFNGGEFRVQKITTGATLSKEYIDRFFKMNSDCSYLKGDINTVIISTVTEDVPSVALKDKIYKLNQGSAAEAFRFELFEKDLTSDDQIDKDTALPFSRGIYSPYLAIYSENKLETGELYNIYSKDYQSLEILFKTRMDSYEPFYAISDRYNFDELNDGYWLRCWRGDCYLNTFTFRLNRNFNDVTLPNNDKIINPLTWKNNYANYKDNEKETVRDLAGNIVRFPNISRSDVNAVLLGNWITINVKSFTNYNLRSIDHSYVSEEATMGNARTFYPKCTTPWFGDFKMPDSYLYNDSFRTSVGFKCYFALNNPNYIKDSFSNRILYSAISILDSFKNNYRQSLSTYYRDYSQEYGGITKLVGFEGYLLVVFEHAIGIAVVNERVLTGLSDGGPVFINTNNVLPQELTIITDTYGTQWSESVVKSEAGYVYGVDTIAKKIWRVKGQQIEILSDFKVNKFLVDNITLGEKELYPIVGLKNVKTHYNNNKKDIMFTFYDNIHKDLENVWNLCYNEILNTFITFYSWVPSYSENIDTQFFTFNRNTSKGIALLAKCNFNIESNTGVLLDSPIFKGLSWSRLYYVSPYKTTKKYSEEINFTLEKDHWGNYKYFSISLRRINGKMVPVLMNTDSSIFNTLPIIYLEITPKINSSAESDIFLDAVSLNTETVAVTATSTVENQVLTESDKLKPNLSTDFYLHGQAGIFDVKETLKPTYWYNELHPFEFEFVVNDKVGYLKIYNNLVIISNKAEPESFHFEIEGDNYEFSTDKRSMYVRLEATKELYLTLGSDILFDRKYMDAAAISYANSEQAYRLGNKYLTYNEGLTLQVKSTIFPLYYEKVDTYNDIYHSYLEMSGINYDFKNLSGSEIKWDRDLNLFNIVTHIKNSPIDKFGRLRGNSIYKEGKWNILIPTIIFNEKNENPWKANMPPIVINSLYVPKDIVKQTINYEYLPNIYKGFQNNTKDEKDLRNYIDTSLWTYRKEANIRDKWMKVRIRYSGKNIAIIHSVITLYNISYA